MKFVAAVRHSFLGTPGKVQQVGRQLDVDFDHTDPANTELAFLATWNASATNWFGVESDTNYYATMLTLLERFEELNLPVNGPKCTILSLGTGPGLYELFLCHYLRSRKVNFRLHSLDYSNGMIGLQKTILEHASLRVLGKSVGVARDSISIVQGDMSDLSAFAGKVDMVICNNSLQWVPNWKKVVQQIGTTMKPQGLGHAMFFVHHHAMQVVLGDIVIERELMEPAAIAEEMYSQRFNMVLARSLLGGSQTGQSNAAMNRVFLHLKHYPTGTMPERKRFSGGVSNVRHLQINPL